MNIEDSKRKLKALEILATVNAHKKRTIYQRLSEQQKIVQRLEVERDLIQHEIDGTVVSPEGGAFCPELYSAKLGYVERLHENKGACDRSIAKNYQILDKEKNLLSELTSRVNLIDDKYTLEKVKFMAAIINYQEAR